MNILDSFCKYENHNEILTNITFFSASCKNNTKEIDQKIRSLVNSNIELISVVIEKEKIEWTLLCRNPSAPTKLVDSFSIIDCEKRYGFLIKSKNVDIISTLKHLKIPIQTDDLRVKFLKKGMSYPIIAIQKEAFENKEYFIKKLCKHLLSFSPLSSNKEINYKDRWGDVVLKSPIPEEALNVLNQKKISACVFLFCLKIKKIKLPKFLTIEILSQAKFF